MPTLEKILLNHDLGFLRIIASLWGVELTSAEPANAAAELASTLCDAELLEEIITTLPETSQAALGALSDTQGRHPWDAFTRTYGPLREMGPGKRDREQPYLHPTSTTESLWYRSLLARAFFDTEKGPQEFAFIPDDLLEALAFIGFSNPEPGQPASPEPKPTNEPIAKKASPAAPPNLDQPLGRPATPAEKAIVQNATDGLLEDLTTLLAALRTGHECPPLAFSQPLALELLAESRLIQRPTAETSNPTAAPNLFPEAIKTFLESPRAESLALLSRAWRASPTLNDLHLIPSLICEGGWSNTPLATRQFLLDTLALLPKNQWWSLPALIRDLKAQSPDFQRQAGEYDTWFIKRQSDGLYLRGFGHWDEVEGALIRQIISSLHGLGLADVAMTQEGGPFSAFRLLEKAEVRAETGKININSNGRISMLRPTTRSVRYQIARFCEWQESPSIEEYRYRVTPQSLKQANAQGLKASQLLSLLAKNAAGAIPPSFLKAVQRWEINGTEARLEHLAVLRVARPEVMNEMKNSKAGRFLAEALGPTAAVIKPGAEAKIMEALSELGLLAEVLNPPPSQE
jgi:hypothetical protein